MLPDLLRYQDLQAVELTRHGLDRLVDAGGYKRISPGLFLRAGVADDTTAGWMAASAKRTRATICLLSALAMHDLTDDIPAHTDLAIPRGTQPVRIDHAPIAWHRFDLDTFDLGRDGHALPGGLSIGLYSPERTIVDLFRLRHAWGSDLATGALKSWLRERGTSPSVLLDMASHFPHAQPAIRAALEILL